MKSKMIFCQMEETVVLPLYATTIGYWEHQNETVRPAGFPDYQLHQVLEGKGELIVNEERYIVGPGDVFFLYPDIPHSYTPISREWKLSWISFNGREAGQMLQYAGIRKSGPSRLREGKLLSPLREMLTMMNHNELGANLELSKLLYALLLDMKLNLVSPLNEDFEMERIKSVLQHIERNLHRALPLKELAEVASVSPQYLCRLFQRTLHDRPVTYINKQRINRSKQLMFDDREKKMYEIAQLVGFDNASYFCAVFKRVTGLKPEEFKMLHGWGR
ncbi:AraC family transcriptional regulator [Paenibacillus macquariensis]|uniref:AraC-type DNA-binding protein n=1 Tax=Paenibacillus macquariensis TaxID=948756 RepID=A0ABY1JLC7_9BACL|nr:AraC family transcriptional regulator [Paenibacillus macquariensis]MEC0090132.1 AraC family transcriptional regulator [Paenibacillus macquariensis]OAB30999.1 AraC family transcriptional regulator [Paenibacillus macquariensis subsp. macquariensis]SIQ38271.1 AraC-type DNA-binding protein [Paenibacillus macquariensis]